MIIKSDQTNTGAFRNYNMTHASYVRHDAWNASGSMQFSLTHCEVERQHSSRRSKNGSFADAATNDGESRPAKDSAVGGGTGSMKNLMEQMGSTSEVRRLSISDAISNLQKLRQRSLDYLFDMLFGRRSRTNAISSPDDNAGFSELMSAENTKNYGAGESYYSCFYYSEQETTCFDAQGTAITADGRQIPFKISLEMSRSFTQIAEQQIDLGKPRLCDPLVVNISGNGADVTDQKFFFDIDADGEKEEISSLGASSGFLALDANENGTIDDGSELFGTKSGNGFSDLAAFDEDHNGWIDEADAIFSRLKIWVVTNGRSELLSLADAGVGAICLRHENTEFSLNSAADNRTNAIVRATGFFLYEEGGSGTIQQLDLAT